MMQDTILVRLETSPEDIHGMHAAKGILTARGGMTSHAAVVARGMGRPCVSGSSEITIDYELKQFKAGEVIIKEGDVITIDGGSGKVMKGLVPTVQPEISGYFSTIMKWADEFRKLKVRTNAETETDSKTAREFGAEGIGLCRTEHMFFDEERILSVRQMILSKSKEDRDSALDKLLPHQKEDFKKIFKVMSGLPVTVRLLDPPLHEFLPKAEKDIEEVARSLNLSAKEVKDRISELHEENPMLGHRGCRLGISFPEIYEMQCRAIFEAIVELKKEKVKSAFGAKFADDRWNPADVWFYKDEAVKQIKDMISHSSVMDNSFMGALPKSKQKGVAIYDVKQLNELLLILYEKNILIPVSLKKATGSGAVFTSRVGINNGRKDENNQPEKRNDNRFDHVSLPCCRRTSGLATTSETIKR